MQEVHEYMKQTGKTPLDPVTFGDLVAVNGGQAPAVDEAAQARQAKREQLQKQLAELDAQK